jgi:uncharacterized membrane protein
MFNLIHLHPMLVHFPISLFFTSVLCDFIYKFTKNQDFKKMGYFLLILAVLAGFVATGSGILIEDKIESSGISEEHIDDHRGFALIAMASFTLLLSFRFFKKNQIADKWFSFYLILSLAGLILLSIAGSYGGRLVFEDGAGVNPSHITLKK